MEVIARQVRRDDPNEREFGVVVSSLREYLIQDNRLILLVLAGVVAFVLLIACANLAGLLLTRGIGRQSEMALAVIAGRQPRAARAAVPRGKSGSGGHRWRAWRAARRMDQPGAGVPRQDAVAFGQLADVRFGWRVLLRCGTGVFDGTCVWAGAGWASRVDLQQALKGRSRGSIGNRGQAAIHRGAGGQRGLRWRWCCWWGQVCCFCTFAELLDVKLSSSQNKRSRCGR
jgi:hypothetical protein